MAAAIFLALSELASNTAVAALAMPLLAAAAAGVGQHPLVLMAAGTLGASGAFMLPVSTPPNAIAFASGRVRIGQMVRAGIWLNLVSLVVVTLLVYFLAPAVFG
jgi:sodium-dependent dicarboxylate transporter 2/3/5